MSNVAIDLTKTVKEIITTMQNIMVAMPIPYTLNLSSLDNTKFYPVTFPGSTNIFRCEIHSPSWGGSAAYNQNILSFRLSDGGWGDTPHFMVVEDYACYDNKEITIGCVGVNSHEGEVAIWLRGGMNYQIKSNREPTINSTDVTLGAATFTVGTNYYGGAGNSYVNICFTPQSTKTALQAAIDAAVLAAKQAVYPVGSVYVSITDSRNPNAILGFGTWEALPAGYGLVAQGTATAEDGSTLTFTAGSKTGEFKHQLTVGELPKTEVYATYADDAPITISCTGEGTRVLNINTFEWSKNNGTANGGNVMISFGSSLYHNNTSPNLVAYLWVRTA